MDSQSDKSLNFVLMQLKRLLPMHRLSNAYNGFDHTSHFEK